MSDGDVERVENLEFVFVKDSDETTVAGLTHGEMRHVDARDAVGQGCFGREGQGEVPFGGSSHGAFVRGGDSDAVGGRLCCGWHRDVSSIVLQS